MKEIIIFGDLPIATKVAKYVSKRSDICLAAVVIGNENPRNNDPWDEQLLIDYAKDNNLKVLTLDEIAKSEKIYYLGISCRFSKIFKKDVIKKFTLGIVNFHGGLLPEFGGLYSVVHTILSGSSIGGGTIHWVNEGIDTGDVIKRCEVIVSDTDDAYDLFVKTQNALIEGFEQVFDEIITGTSKSQTIQQLVSLGYPKQYFDKNSLDEKRFIKIDDINTESAVNTIRAFSFLDYPPAYTEIYGAPVALRYRKNDSN
ncbi:hypothetical protein H8R01_11530 [Vibrio metschnikovii]|uniref:formyltransferase family protein n=1 Tax=Vibrio metschnikovii TaxID=28172 RepID=UPI001643FE7C|nr:formyltransferase family protein [Vibrio metschnikovii]MBC3618012.1 hypothetical protein [Vibrio metschnikovii]MBC5813956.1 hypothetical protein [Vibrio metschnikovii]